MFEVPFREAWGIQTQGGERARGHGIPLYEREKREAKSPLDIAGREWLDGTLFHSGTAAAHVVMKIGIIGYQRSGKSTLFEWLTGVAADPSLAHTAQSAMAVIPDPRVEPLCAIYAPKKTTLASLEVVDTPGLSRDHEGSASRLALIREAGCLIQVIGAYDRGADPAADLRNLPDDFLLADLEIVTHRVERLRESLKKPRPNRAEQLAELAAVEPILAHLEAGRPLRSLPLSRDQEQAIRSFSLLTLKPRMAIFNLPDDTSQADHWQQLATPDCPVFAIPVSFEREMARMEPDEQKAFRDEMGVASFDRDQLLRTMMDVSGQMLFFTAGEKEVRTWLIPKQSTAVEAAAGIHTDLARGFIRAETMSCADLLRLGSEREVKARNLMRQEPKDYVIQDGDILNIRFSV